MEVHLSGLSAEPLTTCSPATSLIENVEIEEMVTCEKVKKALGSFEPYKSPSPDGILPALLQHVLENVIAELTLLFRASFKLNYIPLTWKTSEVVFIPKNGRNDYHLAKAYRPICLSSVLLKTVEHLVDWHIRGRYLSNNSKLSDAQHAFKCTQSMRRKRRWKKESVLHACLVIKKAFIKLFNDHQTSQKVVTN